MDTISELLKLGLVGVLSGLFSAYIALRGHRKKRWWELRVSAYQSLIEALSDLSYYYGRKFVAEIEGRKVNEEYEKQLKVFWDESYHKVRKAADVGAFLFSDEVNTVLKEFQALDNNNHESYFEYIDSHSGAVDKCLKTVVSSAKRDLKVEGEWL